MPSTLFNTQDEVASAVRHRIDPRGAHREEKGLVLIEVNIECLMLILSLL